MHKLLLASKIGVFVSALKQGQKLSGMEMIDDWRWMIDD